MSGLLFSAPCGTLTRTLKNPSLKPTVEPAEPSFQQQHHTNPFANTLIRSIESLCHLYLLGSFGMSTRGSPAVAVAQPPKLPLTKSATSSIATRKQTATSDSLTTGRSKQDMMNAPACGSSIFDVPSARKYLIEHFLLQPNQDPDNPSLSCALLHLTFAQGITTLTADMIRSVAILFDTLLPIRATPSPENTPPVNIPSLTEQIDKLSASVQEIREATDINRRLAEALTRTIDVSKEEMHAASQPTLCPCHPQLLQTKRSQSHHPKLSNHPRKEMPNTQTAPRTDTLYEMSILHWLPLCQGVQKRP